MKWSDELENLAKDLTKTCPYPKVKEDGLKDTNGAKLGINQQQINYC